jgi:hypothetical protein
MEDLGKGIRGFRKGLGDSETPPPAAGDPPRQVPDQNATNTQRETDNAQN